MFLKAVLVRTNQEQNTSGRSATGVQRLAIGKLSAESIEAAIAVAENFWFVMFFVTVHAWKIFYQRKSVTSSDRQARFSSVSFQCCLNVFPKFGSIWKKSWLLKSPNFSASINFLQQTCCVGITFLRRVLSHVVCSSCKSNWLLWTSNVPNLEKPRTFTCSCAPRTYDSSFEFI